MLQLSQLILIFAFARAGFASTKERVLLYSVCVAFAMSLRENGDIHRGEQLSIDPSENLGNSL